MSCNQGGSGGSGQEFDHLQRSVLNDIANIDLVNNNSTWAQASLPVWSGGLGIRSAVQLAPSTFLASVAGSSEETRGETEDIKHFICMVKKTEGIVAGGGSYYQ